MNTYDAIYEELCERVEYGELTLEDAEILNEAAYDRYVVEASRMDKEALSLRERLAEMDRRYEKETDPRMKQYLYNKMNKLLKKYELLENRGIDAYNRADKLKNGHDDARKLARGEIERPYAGIRSALVARDYEGDIFTRDGNVRKPGHYLRYHKL